MRIGALTQEYDAQYTSAVNNTIEKDNAFSSILFDKNEQSVIEAGISSQEVEITDQDYEFNNEKPTFYWHDGQFGYQAEVYKNEGTDSEYTVKLRYDDGRTIYVIAWLKLFPLSAFRALFPPYTFVPNTNLEKTFLVMKSIIPPNEYILFE